MNRYLVTTVASSLLITACGADADDGPLSPELHECVPYEATEVSETFSTTYTEPNNNPAETLAASFSQHRET